MSLEFFWYIQLCRLGVYLKLEENTVLYQIGAPADTMYSLSSSVLWINSHKIYSPEGVTAWKNCKGFVSSLYAIVQNYPEILIYAEHTGNAYPIYEGTIIGEQMMLSGKVHSTITTVKEESGIYNVFASVLIFV